jgi:hypothetical protein
VTLDFLKWTWKWPFSDLTWKMKYQFVSDNGNWKPGFWNPDSWLLSKKAIMNWTWVWLLSLVEDQKPKNNNQQLLRNKLKLKYEVNLRFETQIWKPGPDLKMKIWKWENEFQVYFKKSIFCRIVKPSSIWINIFLI